jgi:AcrR family transcriptional regulator
VSPSSPAAPVPLLGLRERSKRERRARIEEAARQVFREKGFEAATTREIATRAGVGTGTLFVYARDKRELLRMVFRDQLEELSTTAFADVPAAAPLIEQLMHVFRPRYAFWGADPRLSRHAVRETFGSRYGGEEDGKGLPAASYVLHDRLTALIVRNQSAGRIDAAIEPLIATRLLLDVYYNENRDWIADPVPDIGEGIARLREVLALALRALASG